MDFGLPGIGCAQSMVEALNRQLQALLCALITCFVLICGGSLPAQIGSGEPQVYQQGRVTISWGYNRAAFTRSNLHFIGPGYDFTLRKVRAHDRPSIFSVSNYLKPANIWIPQYNYRIGYCIHDGWHISIGLDHMKYVMKTNQVVRINGHISDSHTDFDGEYENDTLRMVPEFLTFEHTDGLNYINTECRRYIEIQPGTGFSIQAGMGAGAGLLVPRTDTKLMNMRRYDEFHLAGYGINMLGSLQFTFGRHFYIQTEGKIGHIRLPDIRTTMFICDRADQNFWFAQVNVMAGVLFSFSGKLVRLLL